MPHVTVEVPRMLRDCTEGRAAIGVEVERLDGVGGAIRRAWPLLATHVFTEDGGLRPHVLLLHNDRLLPRGSSDEVRLEAGDRISIVQAVSGG